jgi:hypothetical protein
MKKVLKIAFLLLLVGFIVIQFINRPDKTVNMEITADDITKQTTVPANVHAILKRSCYDCHSNQTVWPWYTSVAPASWLVGEDVVEGKKKMNFSEWGKMSGPKKEARLNEVCEQSKSGEMPLPNYLIIHSDAKLSQEDMNILCTWAEGEIKKLEEAE